MMLSRRVGKSILIREFSDDFSILRSITNPAVDSAINWLSALSKVEQDRLVAEVFDENGRGSLADSYFAFASSSAGPRFVFKDRKRLLKHFLRSPGTIEFASIDAETIMAFWNVERFKIVTTICASNRLYNIECGHIVTSDDPQMSGRFSLLGAIGLYHGDCWKSDNLELEAAIQAVSLVLEESRSRLKGLLEEL